MKTEPKRVTILNLPNFLNEIKPHLKNKEMDISNDQMAQIFTWMLIGISAENVAKKLEAGEEIEKPTEIFMGFGIK